MKESQGIVAEWHISNGLMLLRDAYRLVGPTWSLHLWYVSTRLVQGSTLSSLSDCIGGGKGGVSGATGNVVTTASDESSSI